MVTISGITLNLKYQMSCHKKSPRDEDKGLSMSVQHLSNRTRNGSFTNFFPALTSNLLKCVNREEYKKHCQALGPQQLKHLIKSHLYC